MPIFHRLALLLLLAAVGCISNARAHDNSSCDDATKSALANTHSKSGSDSTVDTARMICKVWPAHPDRLLVALPLMTTTSDDESTGDLDLLIVNKLTMQIQQRLLLGGSMNDDAMRIDYLTFDTANYQLAPGITAFGVRFYSKNSSRVDPFEEEDLYLFAIRDHHLAMVLDGIVMFQDSGEWDGNCAGTSSTIRRTLSMGKSANRGAYDIVASGSEESRSSAIDKQGKCRDLSSIKKAQPAQLRFDGKFYPVPEAMKTIR